MAGRELKSLSSYEYLSPYIVSLNVSCQCEQSVPVTADRIHDGFSRPCQ